jgi:hypothetical protein
MAEAVTRHTRRGLRPATALRLAATLLLALLVPFHRGRRLRCGYQNASRRSRSR